MGDRLPSVAEMNLALLIQQRAAAKRAHRPVKPEPPQAEEIAPWSQGCLAH